MECKTLGVCFVIVACGAFGFKMAADIRYEIKLLNDLINILNYMECELNYRLTPLPQLCRTSAKRGKSLERLFQCFADELDAQISVDASSCMDAAIIKTSGQIASVESLVKELGASFGKFDLDGQLNGIETVRQKSVNQLQELELEKDIRMRNCQTLGMCAGVTLAILLF